MSDILDRFKIDITYGEKPTVVNDDAQKESEKQQRNKKLIWIGFAVIIGYFAYLSFKK